MAINDADALLYFTGVIGVEVARISRACASK